MSFALKGINHQYPRGNTDRREFLGKLSWLTAILGNSAAYLGISGLAAAQENSSEAERENGSSGKRSRRKRSSGEGRRGGGRR